MLYIRAEEFVVLVFQYHQYVQCTFYTDKESLDAELYA